MEWCRHSAVDNQLKVTLKEILIKERVGQQCESGRSGEIKGGSDWESTDI